MHVLGGNNLSYDDILQPEKLTFKVLFVLGYSKNKPEQTS